MHYVAAGHAVDKLLLVQLHIGFSQRVALWFTRTSATIGRVTMHRHFNAAWVLRLHSSICTTHGDLSIMPYIGKSPSVGVRNRFVYQATAGQTSFSGSDADSKVLTYQDGLYLDVYQNGVLLKARNRLYSHDRYNSCTGHRGNPQ